MDVQCGGRSLLPWMFGAIFSLQLCQIVLDRGDQQSIPRFPVLPHECLAPSFDDKCTSLIIGALFRVGMQMAEHGIFHDWELPKCDIGEDAPSFQCPILPDHVPSLTLLQG